MRRGLFVTARRAGAQGWPPRPHHPTRPCSCPRPCAGGQCQAGGGAPPAQALLPAPAQGGGGARHAAKGGPELLALDPGPGGAGGGAGAGGRQFQLGRGLEAALAGMTCHARVCAAAGELCYGSVASQLDKCRLASTAMAFFCLRPVAYCALLSCPPRPPRPPRPLPPGGDAHQLPAEHDADLLVPPPAAQGQGGAELH